MKTTSTSKLSYRYLYALGGSVLFLCIIGGALMIMLYSSKKYAPLRHLLDKIRKDRYVAAMEYYSDNNYWESSVIPESGYITNRMIDNIHRVMYGEKFDLTEADIVLLGTLPNLSMLMLEHAHLSEAQLNAIGKSLKNLTELVIGYSKLPDITEFQHLGLPNLDLLLIYYSEITEDGISAFNNLPIKRLSLALLHVTEKGLINMLPLDNLEQVNLADVPITDNVTEFFDSCPKLREIEIWFSTETALKSKRNFLINSFQELVIDAGRVSDINFVDFKKRFKCLFLRDLKNPAAIRRIDLMRVDLDDEMLVYIERFENLKVFSAYDSLITEKSLPLLERLAQRMSVKISSGSDENGDPLFRFEKGQSFWDEYFSREDNPYRLKYSFP